MMLQVLRELRRVGFIWVALYTAAVGFSAWVGVNVADRASPVGDVTIRIEKPEQIAPGGYLLIDVIVFYYQSCTAKVGRSLYDSNGIKHNLPTMLLEQPSGVGLQHSASRFPIPDGFAPGPAEYRSQVFYACNAFQRWFWPYRAPQRVKKFTVLDRRIFDNQLDGLP